MSIIDLNAGLTKVESGLTSYNSYDPTVAKYFLAATPSLYGNFAVTKSTQTFLPGLGEGPLLSATRTNTSLTFNGSSQYTGSKIIKRFIYWDQLLTSNLFTSLTI
jgi:hypothetical protein